MDSTAKKKIIDWLENGQVELALTFIRQLETHDGNYTGKQRAGAWLYMTMRAQALNDAGLDVRKVMKPTYNIPWTKDMVHDLLWIPIQKAMFKTDTMKALKKSQVSQVYDVIERELAEKHGIDQIPFPSDEREQSVAMMQVNNRSKEDYPIYEEPLI